MKVTTEQKCEKFGCERPVQFDQGTMLHWDCCSKEHGFFVRELKKATKQGFGRKMSDILHDLPSTRYEAFIEFRTIRDMTIEELRYYAEL